MDTGDVALGAFLRARRERVDPSDLGFPANGRRRTPGLRREEVASLAGVSVEYLTRLEQGRSSRPSTEVVDALARALRLSREAHQYLRLLAGIAPPRVGPVQVRESLIESVEALAPSAAYLATHRLDLVTATPAARAIYAPVLALPEPNFLRWIFLHEDESRRFYPNWPSDAENAVAYLRSLAGPDHGDPAVDNLVAELSAASPEFRRLWNGHEVRPCASGVKVINHPAVGPLDIMFDSFPSADEAATLVLLRPAGDARSRTAFDLLTTVELDFA